MMKHTRAIFFLDAFDGEELNPRRRAALEKHLAGCAPCAAHAEKSRALAVLFRGLPAIPAASRFEEALSNVRQRTLGSARSGEARGSSLAELAALFHRMPVAVPVLALGAFLVALVLAPATRSILFSVHQNRGGAIAQGPKDTPSFKVVRQESGLRIEWVRNGHEHRVRKASDPVSAKVAGSQVIRNRVWNDTAPAPPPGKATFYLID